MSSGSWPNFNAWLQTAWGAGGEFWAGCSQGLVIGIDFGQNPPWYLDDLLTLFPKFFGPPSMFANAGLANASKDVALSDITNLAVGQFLQATGLPPGTIITGLTSGGITVSNAATLTNAAAVLTVYAQPVIPIAVLSIYIALASASLQQVRWQEQWYLAMGWFVAHYATLYARSDAFEMLQVVQAAMHGEVPIGARPGTAFTLSAAPPGGALQSLTKNGAFLTPGVDYMLTGTTLTMNVSVGSSDSLYALWPTSNTVSTTVYPNAARVAAQGIANGIMTSKSVDSVSAGYTVLESLAEFGQWNLSLYGQMLATAAKIIGSGPMLIW